MTAKSSKKHLSGRVAIVTGAGQAIGRAHAMRLASEGASVVVNDVGAQLSGSGSDRTLAESVVAEIKAAGGMAVANADTVATMDGAKRIVETALDHFKRLDILINNAGNSRPNRIFEATEEDFDSLFGVHVKGSFATIRHASPHFVKQRSGVIINTGSDSGLGHYGHAVYGAAKEALAGLTRSIARDLGPYNIRCNMIRPGAMSRQATHDKTIALHQEAEGKFEFASAADYWLTRTPPGQRKPAVEESADEDRMMFVPQMVADHVADFVTWLCTDAASEINGLSFRVMGGEIGLMSDPQVIRAIFREGRWGIENLNSPGVANYLYRDIVNRYRGPK